MSRGSIVFDLLVLSSCQHPSADKLEGSERITKELEERSSCWRVLEEILRESGSRESAHRGSGGRSPRRVYVSSKSLKNLMRAVMECERRSNLLMKLRYIYVAVGLYGPKQCAVESRRVKKEECDLSGHHAEEYCEVREALGRCELLCDILCVGRTFGENHVRLLARDLGVDVELEKVVRLEELAAMVVEVTKVTSGRP